MFCCGLTEEKSGKRTQMSKEALVNLVLLCSATNCKEEVEWLAKDELGKFKWCDGRMKVDLGKKTKDAIDKVALAAASTGQTSRKGIIFLIA